MTNPSLFECAIRALKQEKGDLPDSILAINMDACAAALCVRSDKGAYSVRTGVQLDSGVNAPVALYESALAKLPRESVADEQQLARAWRRYIQSGKKNESALEGVSCADLESAFAPAAQLYSELFARTDSLLTDDETRILLFGRMAERSLAVYAARSHFSADPFLPDPLFLESEHPEILAECGMHLLEADASRAASFRDCHVALAILDRDGTSDQMILSRPSGYRGRPRPEEPYPDKSFYCGKGDSVQLTVNGIEIRVEIPAKLFEKGADFAMVHADYAADDDGPALILRSGKAREVRIPLKLD